MTSEAQSSSNIYNINNTYIKLGLIISGFIIVLVTAYLINITYSLFIFNPTLNLSFFVKFLVISIILYTILFIYYYISTKFFNKRSKEEIYYYISVLFGGLIGFLIYFFVFKNVVSAIFSISLAILYTLAFYLRKTSEDSTYSVYINQAKISISMIGVNLFLLLGIIFVLITPSSFSTSLNKELLKYNKETLYYFIDSVNISSYMNIVLNRPISDSNIIQNAILQNSHYICNIALNSALYILRLSNNSDCLLYLQQNINNINMNSINKNSIPVSNNVSKLIANIYWSCYYSIENIYPDKYAYCKQILETKKEIANLSLKNVISKISTEMNINSNKISANMESKIKPMIKEAINKILQQYYIFFNILLAIAYYVLLEIGRSLAEKIAKLFSLIF